MKTEHEIREQLRGIRADMATYGGGPYSTKYQNIIDTLEYVLSGPLALTPLDEFAMSVARGMDWDNSDCDAAMCARVYQIAGSLWAEGKRRREASSGNANH